MQFLLAFVLLPGLLVAQGPDPAHPWPNHERPPDDWHCVPARDAKDVRTNAHACECRGMILDDPEPFCHVPGEDEEGHPIMVPRGESSTCKVWCHRDLCFCSKRCEDS